MQRYDLINWFIREYGYTRYCEIGIDNPNKCFNRIECADKTGIDPHKGKTEPPHHFRITSDAFFRYYASAFVFDIALVDGCHLCEQVVRDVDNLLECLDENGTIIIHDCIPENAITAAEVRTPGATWSGTVWKAWSILRATRHGLHMHVVNQDHGLGIIRPGYQELYEGPYETFDDWQANRDEILQLLSVRELRSHFGKGAAHACNPENELA